ncbi:carbon-nitrogen hydrolase [Lipomyces arxii]|uniref:carbon-nitrogen hydrolase n=1 Tax=Lipomyces arxii TaxID=56418 RepID=UPI0034CF8DD6
MKKSLKIGIIQTDNRLNCNVKSAVGKANLLLNNIKVDLLVAPELAFTGYAYRSPAAIEPYLEPTCAGPTTEWAKRVALSHSCHVIVGYPERADEKRTYNSAVVVDPAGTIIAHHRKHFLFSADEVWGASEGPSFTSFKFNLRGNQFKVALGICMDINPYKFKAPFEAYEFANFALRERADLVVVPMAWTASTLVPGKPELETTIRYWISRMGPLNGTNSVLVAASRAGIEGNTVYAGSSCVVKLDKPLNIIGMLPKSVEYPLIVDVEI